MLIDQLPIAAKEKLFFLCSLVVFFTLFSPSYFYTGTSSFVLLFFTFKLYSRPCLSFVTSNKKSILLLLVALLIGIVFSELPQKSLKGTYDFLRGLVLFFPAFICSRLYPHYRESFEQIGASIIVGGSFLLGWFSLLYFSKSSKSFLLYGYVFAGELFGNVHNLINGVVLLTLFSVALLLLSSLGSIWKLMLSVCLSIFVIFLISMSSEGAYLALLFCLLGYIFYSKRKLRGLILIISVVIMVIFISLFISPQFYQENIHFSLGGFGARANIYSAIIDAISTSPWVGYGINTYKYLSIGQTKAIAHMLLYPHQILLELLFSFGFIGTTLFFLSSYQFLRKSVNFWRANNIFFVLGFLVFIYLSVKGMTGGKLFGFYFSGIFGMSLGFMAGSDQADDMTKNVTPCVSN